MRSLQVSASPCPVLLCTSQAQLTLSLCSVYRDLALFLVLMQRCCAVLRVHTTQGVVRRVRKVVACTSSAAHAGWVSSLWHLHAPPAAYCSMYVAVRTIPHPLSLHRPSQGFV